MRTPPLAIVAAIVGGCGGDPAGGMDMGAAATCATMSMALMPYTGEAAGALAATTGPITAWRGDAYLAGIVGNNISLQGVTSSGMNGGGWVVSYYSPQAKKSYVGSFSGMAGHASCQDVNIARPPAMQPNPRSTSPDAMMTAISRIVADQAPQQPRLPARGRMEYGLVANGANPPRDHAWLIDLSPWVVVVDDTTNNAVECTNAGNPCNN